jgi:hypothetical protein
MWNRENISWDLNLSFEIVLDEHKIIIEAVLNTYPFVSSKRTY